jgi:hypothetical protein
MGSELIGLFFRQISGYKKKKIPEKKIIFLHTMIDLTYLKDLDVKLRVPMDVLGLKKDQR